MAKNSGTLKKIQSLRKATIGGAVLSLLVGAGFSIGFGIQNSKAYSIINDELEYPKYQITQSTELDNQLKNGQISSEEYYDATELVNDKKAFLKQYGSEEQNERFNTQINKCKPLFYCTAATAAIFGALGITGCITGVVEVFYEDKLKKAEDNLLDEKTPI